MGIWGSLFSTGEIVGKGVDAVISAGDKLMFTEEERADMNLKMREHHLKLLEASQPFKVAQRLLAVWFSILFGISFLVGIGMTIANIIIKYNNELELSKMDAESIALASKAPLLDIAPLMALVNAFDLGIIMITVVGFYFGGAIVSSYTGKQSQG